MYLMLFHNGRRKLYHSSILTVLKYRCSRNPSTLGYCLQDVPLQRSGLRTFMAHYGEKKKHRYNKRHLKTFVFHNDYKNKRSQQQRHLIWTTQLEIHLSIKPATNTEQAYHILALNQLPSSTSWTCEHSLTMDVWRDTDALHIANLS